MAFWKLNSKACNSDVFMTSYVDRTSKARTILKDKIKGFRLTKPTFGLVIILSNVAPGQIAVAQPLQGTPLLVNVLLLIDLCLPTYTYTKYKTAISVIDQL